MKDLKLVKQYKGNTPNFFLIAGPCSVESEEQILEIAKFLKQKGIKYLRGGAFKPRTSPYSFQGLQEQGIELLKKVKKQTGLKIVTEVMDTKDIDLISSCADILQVGARNMHNFSLLKELGKTKKPILLKRGLAATIEEFLYAAEYILKEGNQNIILCERGIRTFETSTRNTLDLSAIPLIKSITELPIIVDPSHGTGVKELITPMSKAAIAAGADGLIIEVHNNPQEALSDKDQSLNFQEFSLLLKEIDPYLKLNNKNF